MYRIVCPLEVIALCSDYVVNNVTVIRLNTPKSH